MTYVDCCNSQGATINVNMTDMVDIPVSCTMIPASVPIETNKYQEHFGLRTNGAPQHHQLRPSHETREFI
jgi:hypothetical protein